MASEHGLIPPSRVGVAPPEGCKPYRESDTYFSVENLRPILSWLQADS